MANRVLYILLALGLLYIGFLQDQLGAVLPIVILLIAVQVFFILRARRSRGAEERLRRSEAVLREAEKLEKTDPAAAQRMLEQHFAAEEQLEARELAELRTKAQYDAAAAKELDKRLRDDLRAQKLGQRLLALKALLQRVPSWLRPSLYGAAALFLIMAARILFAIPWLIRRPADIPQLLFALLVVTAAGAAGGLGYTLLGKHLRPIPGVGPYLAGIAAVGGYMAALLVAMPLIDPTERLISDRSDAIIFAVGTAFFGVVFGHAAFRD